MGIATGKRLDRRAVVRNRVRRRLREAVRELPLSDGYDVVVLARHPALTLGFAALAGDVRRMFSLAGLVVEGES